MFHDQASAAMFVPGFMASCCHTKPLLAVPKAQKASLTIRTSENRTPLSWSWTAKSNQSPTLLWIVQLAYCQTTLGWQDVKSLHSQLDFVEIVYHKLTWLPFERCCSLTGDWATEAGLWDSILLWKTCWHFVVARVAWEDDKSLCSSSDLENNRHTMPQYKFHG